MFKKVDVVSVELVGKKNHTQVVLVEYFQVFNFKFGKTNRVCFESLGSWSDETDEDLYWYDIDGLILDKKTLNILEKHSIQQARFEMSREIN